MAKRPFNVMDALYLGNAPRSQDPLEDSPLVRGITGGRKARTKGKRDLNVRVPRQATISAPKRGAVQTAYDLLNRYTPAVSPAVQAFEGLTGAQATEDAVTRGLQQLISGTGYAENPDLQTEDAILLGLTGAAGPVLKGIGKVGGAIGRRLLPEGLIDNTKAFFTEGRPLFDRDYVDAPFSVSPASDLASAPRALPAPPKQLALPAPGPGLPSFAAKPRGGQWWPNSPTGAGALVSPETAARSAAEDIGVRAMRWEPEDYGVIQVGQAANPVTEDALFGASPEQQWLEKALTKYYKTDFGSPDDPLRSLAERGLHYDPEMTPERWQKTVNDYLMEDRIGDYTVPGEAFYNPKLLEEAPWLAKQPVTDKIYGISSGGLDLEHFTDEFYNALNAAEAGLPSDLAVRPESLSRMSFPQAVEHVGKINQWRAKELERAALDAQNNPVTHLFKEYPEDNPMGLRWVEMAPPKSEGPTNYDVEEELRKALKYEGDTMGHCVGGYCPDVMSGRSRIFSLRDAKGEPHVTIETQPSSKSTAAADHLRNLGVLEDWQNYWKSYPRAAMKKDEDIHDVTQQFLVDRGLPPIDYSAENIIQIKGKQNRAPKDDYLPFVQDFVKSQQWGNVGDLGNTGLVRLPDGRYITQQQYNEGLNSAAQGFGTSSPETLTRLVEWDRLSPYFEGYAIGGRVERDRCLCRHPMAAK